MLYQEKVTKSETRVALPKNVIVPQLTDRFVDDIYVIFLVFSQVFLNADKRLLSGPETKAASADYRTDADFVPEFFPVIP